MKNEQELIWQMVNEESNIEVNHGQRPNIALSPYRTMVYHRGFDYDMYIYGAEQEAREAGIAPSGYLCDHGRVYTDVMHAARCCPDCIFFEKSRVETP